MHFYRRWLCVFVCIVSVSARAQYTETQQKAIVLRRMIELNHFSPRTVDDSLSSEMFLKCMNELDPHRDIFTANEFNALEAYRYKLDDELRGSGWGFLDLTMKYYQQALKRADSIINTVLQKPLDFNVDDKVIISNDGERPYNFPSSVTELSNRWTRRFKYLILNNIYDIGSADSVKLSLKAQLPKHELAARQKIKKIESEDIQRILDPAGYNTYVTDIYFNALASCFDPHTMYFSPQEKENFQASISTEQYSLGLTIDDNDGKVIVDRLVPGGPAWKSGELNKDDELVQVQWEGKEAVDVSSLTADEVDDILEETNHGNITIRVRKADGIIKTVTLHKEKIETEEDIVRGYVLKGRKKIGYISLPDFYTTWEDEKGSGCANDVAKEIVKLKRENIDGLILDLRYNGGGSLGEALEMAGIFIDEGPLAGVKDKTQKLVFLKDPNRGTIYDGPLLLLVNSQSASASEMLAAALQDYNRAVIAGSPTYGKASMQKIFSLDTLSNNSSDNYKGDVVKITDGKLYRVTGQTAQLKGVIPDVTLPDIFDALKYREKFSPDALNSDTVKRNAYYKPLSPLPVSELSQRSEQRIKDNKNFQDIKTAIQMQGTLFENQTVVLKPDAFEKWIQQAENLRKIAESEDEHNTDLFVAENYSTDKEKMQTDSYKKEINQVVLKNLQHDIYIEEAYNIISDLVKIINKQ
ncbi:MAG: carboxy terminal-processing peptidase [Chitinophagales bacterium]